MDIRSAAAAAQSLYVDDVAVWRQQKEVGADGITREVPALVWQGKGRMCAVRTPPPGEMAVQKSAYCLHLPHGADVAGGDKVVISRALGGSGSAKVTAVRPYMTHDEADLEEVKVY